MCEKIEAERPNDLAALYTITHASTEEFNALAEEFEDQDSEIETAAEIASVQTLHSLPRPTVLRPTLKS